MKYLKNFITPSQYNTFLLNDIELPNVSYIVDTDEVKYNPFSLLTDEELLDKAGTAIVFDTINQKLKPIDGLSYNTTDYPQDIYEPVGVVVMPASHTEDGYARMCSLKYMGVKTDDEGNVTYGAYDESNKKSEKYSGCAWFTTDDYNESKNILNNIVEYFNEKNVNFFNVENPRIPIISYDEINGPDIYNTKLYEQDYDGFINFTNINLEGVEHHNNDIVWIPYKNTEYGWNAGGNYTEIETAYYGLAGSPYNANGTPNLNIRDGVNKMVHGDKMSNMIYEYIDNITVNERLDLFNASKLYYTAGTNQKEWYIPSMLELAYFGARAKEIYFTIKKMNPYFFESYVYDVENPTHDWPKYLSSCIYPNNPGHTNIDYFIFLSNVLKSKSITEFHAQFYGLPFASVKIN